MECRDLEEIIACLPQERSHFRYFKDYYALQLLGWIAGEGISLEGLRCGPFAPLLQKPLVRPLLAACGDGRLNRQQVSGHWVEPSLPFLLTLGRWQGGGWRQTSRPGWNLVLRLNFPQSHDRHFRKQFVPYYGYEDLNLSAHPVLEKGERSYFRQTLAWARLDLDLDRGEALIEEVQTDWVREARDAAKRLERCRRCTNQRRLPSCRSRLAAMRYLDQVLAPYTELWDQAMLSATLFFLFEELGIRDIWYHQWETGNLLKDLGRKWLPPRSLYTRLPRRFCFREHLGLPRLLDNRRTARRLLRARIEPRFYRLSL
jgi:hypothetical protein